MKIINNKQDAIQELKRISTRTNSENNNKITATVEEILREVKNNRDDLSVKNSLENDFDIYLEDLTIWNDFINSNFLLKKHITY